MEDTSTDAPDHGRQAAGSGGWQRTSSPDGTVIAWRAEGPPVRGATRRTPVVLCNGIACSTGYWAPLVTQLVAARQVVQWDYRGHGRSGVPAARGATTIDDVLADLGAVLDAARITRAVVGGHSFGVQVALEAARRRPDAVAAVVAVAGAAGHPLPDGATTSPVSPLTMVQRAHGLEPDVVDRVWRRWWHSPLAHLLARAIGGTSLAAPPEVMREYYEHVSTRDIDVLLGMMQAMQAHDAGDLAGDLDVPLLVLAGDADRLTSLPRMAKLALDAPDGELAVCHGGTHTLPIEQPDWIVEQLLPLLDRVDALPAERSPPLTVAPGA
ncbi:MAG TPA: alpha/beta hydrolase [Euzebyales bacterium]